MLIASNLTVVRGGRPVLEDVTLKLAPGSVTAIVGPNGAGKSTLLKALSGELKAGRGQVTLDGRPLAEHSAIELAARRAVLPQNSELAFPFTVLEIVRLAFAAGGGGTRKERDKAAMAALEEVELKSFAARFYQQLSGGEQQRVQLARVLCQIAAHPAAKGSRFLLLDEPTSNLDLVHQLGVVDIVKRRAAAGLGVVAILHDLNLASLAADRLVMLKAGAVRVEGPPAVAMNQGSIATVYGLPLQLIKAPETGTNFVLPQVASPTSTP